MVWKSNFDCVECSESVKLEHKSAASSTSHLPLNSHPSVLRSQVSSSSKDKKRALNSIQLLQLQSATNHIK